MKNGKSPDPNVVHPIEGYENEIYVKPTITNPRIIVGDFTYIADAEFEDVTNRLNEMLDVNNCTLSVVKPEDTEV